MQNEVKKLILQKYSSEAECARRIGWDRQRLNKITTGYREPSIYELNVLAKTLGVSVSRLVPIFLALKSPNEQQKENGGWR